MSERAVVGGKKVYYRQKGTTENSYMSNVRESEGERDFLCVCV